MPDDVRLLSALRWRRLGLEAVVRMGLASDARTRLAWLLRVLTAELNAYLIQHPERVEDHQALWDIVHDLRAVLARPVPQ